MGLPPPITHQLGSRLSAISTCKTTSSPPRPAYTFTDMVRLANVDAVVRRALTGHVTEEMQRHYSHVGLDEKRAALAGVLRLAPTSPTESGVGGGSRRPT